ncbi:MAG: DUF1559 domain-containing protein, partial [Thermoguttaceae bacterium]|nr:DUF1559 domain-containing protein [Thermoguttaceae bacterium]
DGEGNTVATDRGKSNGMLTDGCFGGAKLSVDDVKDGATNTLLISENMQTGDIFYNEEYAIGFCAGMKASPQTILQWGAINASDCSGTLLSGVIAPIQPNVCRNDFMTFVDDEVLINLAGAEASWKLARMASSHPNVVVAAMVDGSTRVVNDKVNFEVLVRAMSPNDKQCDFARQDPGFKNGVLDITKLAP